jgi:hypothetical protein
VAAGIQAVCGASLADPRFHRGPDEQLLRVTRAGVSSITYQLHHPPATADATLAAPEAELFTPG